jgi:hypothetical protein
MLKDTATSTARRATVTRKPQVVTREQLIANLTAAKNELAEVKQDFDPPCTLAEVEMSVALVLQDVCRFLGLSDVEVMRVMGDDYLPTD